MSDSTRALFDALPDGVLGDRGGFVVYANPAARRTLGYRGERELFFRPTDELVHPSERAGLRAWLEGDAAGVLEVNMVRRTGELVPVDVRAVHGDIDGEPARVLLVRDLSERRRLEKELQVADRMASLGTLAAGIAHEINNPLTYILANLEVLDELLGESGELDLAELRQLIDETREGAMRVHTVVHDLKTFTRHGNEAPPSAVALPQIVESVVRMATNQIKHRAELVVELGDTPKVRANPNHLHQVLLNVLVNAAQAIEPGNVKSNQIRITTSADATRNVLVEIADTGCGIPPATLGRIFDPFYTTKDQSHGSGLGLWISHALITQLGGSIAVDSIVGRGTTFRLTLPAASGG